MTITWRDDLRRKGEAEFARLGWPTRKVESWHYTDLSQHGLSGYLAAESGGPRPAQPGLVHLVNGFLAAAGRMPAGATLERLENSAIGQKRIGSLLPPGLPLASLNAGLFTDALVLRLEGQVDAPITIISEGQADSPLQFHGRLLVLADAGSSATLIETHKGAGRYFANHVVEIALGADASLDHILLQDESAEATHVGLLALDLAARARYRGVQLQLGALLARREVQAVLSGDHADFALDGATLATGRQHLDSTTRIVHRAPHCPSRQLFKTVLDEQGHGVFQGTVLVERPAQKTAAHQLSRALMLSDRAAMDNKPELEIFADDVKCGHGATIGDIDETQLFYLRARGVEESVARRMLVEAFLGEVVEQIAAEGLREAYGALLRERLESR